MSLSVPRPSADPSAYDYGYGLLAHPVAYHIPTCSTEEVTITHKVCTPNTQEKCEDVTYLLKLEEVCVDFVIKHCFDGTVATTEVDAEEAPTEVAVEEVTTEVAVEEATTEVDAEEAITEVAAEEATTEVDAEEATTEEAITEVAAEEATTEIAAEEAITKVNAEEATTEIAAAEEAERKKREADPFYGYGLAHGLHGYAHVAPIVTGNHQCIEIPYKACHLQPVEEVVENKVPHCILVDATTCEDVETKVPHTVCH